MKPPIQIWVFEDAPEELQIPYNGGDEDFVILCPPDVEPPYQLKEMGCSDNDRYTVDEEGNVFTEEWDKDDSLLIKVPTDWKCPNYKGYTIIIPSHA